MYKHNDVIITAYKVCVLCFITYITLPIAYVMGYMHNNVLFPQCAYIRCKRNCILKYVFPSFSIHLYMIKLRIPCMMLFNWTSR